MEIYSRVKILKNRFNRFPLIREEWYEEKVIIPRLRAQKAETEKETEQAIKNANWLDRSV